MSDNIWNQVFSQKEWGKYPPLSLVRFVARNFYSKNRPEIKLLELGCGPGANVAYMAREGFQVTGIDGSEVAIEQAQKRLEAEGLGAKLFTSFINPLDFPDAEFDAVLDVECISCNSLDYAEEVVSEVARVLKPGGMFFSITFTDEMQATTKGPTRAPLDFEKVEEGPLSGIGSVRLTTERQVRELYASSGLELLSLDKANYSYNNQEYFVSEWEVIAKKNG